MSHLGERVATLVDGQLGMDAAERALIHLTGCRACRDAVEAERLMKRRLATLAAPRLSGDLMVRLGQLAGPSGPLPPRNGHVPGSPRPQLTPAAGLGARFESFDRPPFETASFEASSFETGPFEAASFDRQPLGAPAFDGEPVDRLMTVQVPFAPGLLGSQSAARPPARRGTTRPPMAKTAGVGRVVRVTRASRNRVAAAMVGAVCLVGAGAAGGVANSGVAVQRISPPVDTFIVEHGAATNRLPYDQTVSWKGVRGTR